jgi:hypothetical protein
MKFKRNKNDLSRLNLLDVLLIQKIVFRNKYRKASYLKYVEAAGV